MRFSSVSIMSNGTTSFPCFFRDRYSIGCIALAQSNSLLSSTTGMMAFTSLENIAFALTKSISARNSYD
ncbi:hypothetical protein EVA_16548 [gut metagenome]|uniref:Uncharacterized protein n=1 Tax=gut metagenome TaxID=749906 RepID=J9FKB0_9ZZZZ